MTRSKQNLSERDLKTCGDTKFESELEFRRHKYKEHSDDRTISRTSADFYLSFIQSCTQSFVRRHVMKRHFKTMHLMHRNFPCQNRDKAFPDLSTRETHQTVVHEKKRLWICQECSNSFTQSSSLGEDQRMFHTMADLENLMHEEQLMHAHIALASSKLQQSVLRDHCATYTFTTHEDIKSEPERKGNTLIDVRVPPSFELEVPNTADMLTATR